VVELANRGIKQGLKEKAMKNKANLMIIYSLVRKGIRKIRNLKCINLDNIDLLNREKKSFYRYKPKIMRKFDV
jgi:hypothetical protein